MKTEHPSRWQNWMIKLTAKRRQFSAANLREFGTNKLIREKMSGKSPRWNVCPGWALITTVIKVHEELERIPFGINPNTSIFTPFCPGEAICTF